MPENLWNLENLKNQFTDFTSSQFLIGIATLITIGSIIPPLIKFLRTLQHYKVLVRLNSPTQFINELKELLKILIGFLVVYWLLLFLITISYVSVYAVHIRLYCIQGFSLLFYITIIILLLVLLFIHIRNKTEWHYLELYLYALFLTFCISFFLGKLLTYQYALPILLILINTCFAIITLKTNVSHNIIMYDDNIFWKILSYLRYGMVLVVFCLGIIRQNFEYIDVLFIFWMITVILYYLYSLLKLPTISGDMIKFIETTDYNFTSKSEVRYTNSGFIRFYTVSGKLMLLDSKQLRIIKYSSYNIFRRKNRDGKWYCELYNNEKYYFDESKVISQDWVQFATYTQSRADFCIIPKNDIKCIIYSADVSLSEGTRS